jgi:8-oxo-dGTP diphosphatase
MAKTPAAQPRPHVAVEVVLLTPGEGDLLVYLRKRRKAPYRGRLGLPGTLLRAGESTEAAAQRVLDSSTGVQGAHLNQLYTFSDPRRDPRGHTVTVAYYALFPTLHQRANPYPLEDAWMPLRTAIRSTLAFDHVRILDTALSRLKGRLDYTHDVYRLLPGKFSIPQLQHVHEIVRGETLKPDVFTKRVLRNGLRAFQTRETVASPTGGRPARLYRNPALEEVLA